MDSQKTENGYHTTKKTESEPKVDEMDIESSETTIQSETKQEELDNQQTNNTKNSTDDGGSLEPMDESKEEPQKKKTPKSKKSKSKKKRGSISTKELGNLVENRKKF